MYRSGSTDTQSHLASWFFRVMLVIGFACLFIISTTVTASTTYASGRPGGNVTDPVVRAVDIAEPAVVRIITTLGAHLTVHFSQGNVTFPQGTGNSYPVQLSGSGTFITAHGDILTADHVINPPHDPALNQFLDDLAAKDVAAYMNLNAKSGSQVSPNQVDQELKSGQIAASPTYDPATSEVFLNTTYTGPLTATDLANLPFQLHAAVDRIEKESSFNQRDVAIVHVNMNDMASVQLGDSGTVQQQDQLTIIGFPGNGDVSNLPTDLLTASVNTISVSSIKTTDTGAHVIQVGGNVEHGDSGGPALDSNGAVIGIVSFGLVSSDSTGGTSFLQASSSARELVQSLKLNMAPGAFQQVWSKAMTDYASNTSGHWHRAQQEFEQIAAKYPLFKGVTSYLTYTQEQAKTEKVSTTTSPATRPAPTNTFPLLAWIIGGIIVLILLLALFFMVFFRRRRKKKAANRANAGQVSQDQGIQPAPITQRGPNSHPGVVAGQQKQGAPQDDGMTAFGAAPATHTPQPVQQSSTSVQTVVSGTLRPWPCGHMNRSNARFCSICGEPAPEPPTSRRFEQ
ncbi:MAG: trypsin-like serine protease [Chloroflexi bacterium]|nr:MAG: trypsin-like serine protease [Chloroflexota bacterium]